MERSWLIACADTSPCIALTSVDLQRVLFEQFDEVLLPDSVFLELALGIERDHAWMICQSPKVRVVSSSAGRSPWL